MKLVSALFGPRAPAHTEVVTALIRVHLPPLQLRLRADLIAPLVERVLIREPDAEIFLEESESMRAASVVLHLRHVVTDLEAEHEGLAEQFERLSTGYHKLTAPDAKRRFLEGHLRASGKRRRERRADLAALSRELGIDAIRERFDLERHRLQATIELAIDFIGIAAAWIAEHEADSESHDGVTMLAGSDLTQFLATRLERSRRWQTRLACVRCLKRVVDVVAPHGRLPIAPTLVARARDVREHAWVQSGALDVLATLDPAAAQDIIERRLFGADESRPARDFLLRRLVVDYVAHDPDDGLEVLERLTEHRDPSDHVRIGICKAAVRSPASRRATALLRRLSAAPETSATVRTHAVLAAGQIASTAGDDRERFELACSVIAEVLRSDEHWLVLEVAASTVSELARSLDPTAAPEPFAVLCESATEALVDLAGSDARVPRVQEAAAAALEVFDRQADPQRREWTRALAASLQSVRVGRRASLELPGAEAESRRSVGRVLAELTRRDWGVDARLRGGVLNLRRGDRFRTRLWRVLHELRAPAPNKRQGFRHTIGRVLTGDLRAHSGQLDEVTPTVVPGERVYSDVEGGWGRHLPLVDDVLGLPLLRPRPVEIYSSHGVTTAVMRGGVLARMWSRIRLSIHYGRLAGLRLQSLNASETDERGRYTDTLRRDYGIELAFAPHPLPSTRERPVSKQLRDLFPAPAVAHGGAALLPFVPQAESWLKLHSHYFLSLGGNTQQALAIFIALVTTVLFGDAYRRQRRISHARGRLPLSIGGWGTRGKSGTERIKAGLFHGLGYQVFSKTTGCEAMFIHSVPEGPAVEIYAFRPYGKATIWEQRDLLELAADLGSQVFLWECMALNPRYVEILQHSWMRDDYSTITNAYPDHEDIQGPAGINVADTISRFVPRRGTLVTSEINFLPLMRDVCERNSTRLVALDEIAGELVADDLLGLFPYEEHPRNIALVAKLAGELEIEENLAIVTMADHVVPDIGVLKAYPTVMLLGRRVRFVNGCSANERTGYLTSWRRTGLEALDPNVEPGAAIVTMVNNRDDRISRSEVFARIMVEDVSVDKHVIIGTNIRGLLGYLEQALSAFLSSQSIVTPRDFEASGDDAGLPYRRLEKLMARVRIPTPRPTAALDRLRLYAIGAGTSVAGELDDLEGRIAALIEGDAAAPVSLARVRASIAADRELGAALDGCLEPQPPAHTHEDPPEVLRRCTVEEMREHFFHQLAKMIVSARLRARLETVLEQRNEADIDSFQRAAHAAYRELFLDSFEVIYDPKATGDQIVERCARVVPPGTRVTIMGTQNIKGTGLDFVYRWLALESVTDELAKLDHPDANERLAALRRLEAFEDHGLMDLGLIAATLARLESTKPEESALSKRVLDKAKRLHEHKIGALAGGASRADPLARALGWLEGWVEFLDGVRRFHDARKIQRDLIHQRVSHQRAAVLMREIYARAKGGWLVKAVRKIGR